MPQIRLCQTQDEVEASGGRNHYIQIGETGDKDSGETMTKKKLEVDT